MSERIETLFFQCYFIDHAIHGEMIVSFKEMEICRMLIAESGLHGLEMIRRSNGSLKRGTVYATLHRMVGKEYVQFCKEPKGSKGIARRFYSMTNHGLTVYRQQLNLFAPESWGLSEGQTK